MRTVHLLQVPRVFADRFLLTAVARLQQLSRTSDVDTTVGPVLELHPTD